MTSDLTRWLLPLIPVFASLFAAKGIYHIFQLESYQFPGYFRSLRRNRLRVWMPGLMVAAFSMIAYYAYDRLAGGDGPAWLPVAFAAAMLPISVLFGLLVPKVTNEKASKKKFVVTGRVKRLYGHSLVLMAALSLLLAQGPIAVLPTLWPLLLPLVIAFCGFVAWGLEKVISECYFRDARRKLLRQPNLIRIGITGSYGKTTVKHILGTILQEKYVTLITPASFNTPMGVSRAIRERLQPSHQVFVGEMGARHVGDIKELCRLVHPTVGILTSAGPQHLDTFKTVERVAQTKYELIDALPPDGHAYFADDGGICRGLYQKTKKPKTMVRMTEGEEIGVWCENVAVSPGGSTFDLHVREKGSVRCQTKLLGEHNIQNILMAAAVASDLGLSLRQISHGVSKIVPVKSRLELIAPPNNFTIINDAFNSNPAGAKAALRVLAQFPARRIIITPGMVELGEREAEFNRAFGQDIAGAADIAIIVGKKRAQPIIDGLLAAGFPEEHIHRVDSLEASTALLRTIVRPEDTVLYENDLPDHYQDA